MLQQTVEVLKNENKYTQNQFDQQKKLASYDVLNFENEYLEILNYETIDLLNERLGKSVIRIAAYWQYCWTMAGKPNLK